MYVCIWLERVQHVFSYHPRGKFTGTARVLTSLLRSMKTFGQLVHGFLLRSPESFLRWIQTRTMPFKLFLLIIQDPQSLRSPNASWQYAFETLCVSNNVVSFVIMRRDVQNNVFSHFVGCLSAQPFSRVNYITYMLFLYVHMFLDTGSFYYQCKKKQLIFLWKPYIYIYIY